MLWLVIVYFTFHFLDFEMIEDLKFYYPKQNSAKAVLSLNITIWRLFPYFLTCAEKLPKGEKQII
jgi:hypothetical protein